MKTKGIWGLALVVLLSFTSVFAQPFDVVRDDFQVNQTTEGSMTSPRMARSGNGSFVIVWVQEIDTTLSHIRGRLYDDNGQEIGDEFRVNSGGESSYKSRPRVDMNIHGEFAVVWKDNRDDWRKAVYGRAYDGNGNPLSDDFRVSPADSQFIKGEIAIDGEGYLRIAYVKQSPNEVSVMLFDCGGSPVEQLAHYPRNFGTYRFAMIANDYGCFSLIGISYCYNAKCEIFDRLGESISGLFQIRPYDGSAWVEPYQVTDIEIRNDNYIYTTSAGIFGGAYSCDPHPERHYNLFNPDGERVNGFYQSHTTYDPLMGMSISGSVSFGWSDGGAKGAWADNSFSGFRDIWDVSNEGAGQVRDVATECDDTRIFYTWSDDRN
ncbi:MAG: hypothetical protein GY855_10550, partial [candidate division Zixibacteria bacterium]|nr:hypothetical protein [candidate division Zixibacteria bacterium]